MKQNEKGFSLMELIVVMALFAIIAMVVMPNIKLVDKQRVNKMAKELSTDFMTLRTKALNDTGNAYEFILEGASGIYYTYKLSPALPLSGGKQREMNTDNPKIMKLTITTKNSTGLDNAAPVTNLKFKEGKIIANGDDTITEVKITIKYKDQTAVFSINHITGYHQIVVN